MSRRPDPRASRTSGLAPNPRSPSSSSSSGSPPPNATSAVSRSGPDSRVEPPPLSVTAGPMPGTLERPIHGPKKRLVVTCDGTWLDSDNGLMNGQKQPPSNVSRIGWAIKDTSRDGIPQVVFYQAGVGSSGGPGTRALGGATGAGLKENVREAYTFLATNWRPGDEIFLIGFSRGAFTARSVGGVIGALGLLTKDGLPSFSEIFEDFEHRYDDHYRPKYSDVPFPDKPPFGDQYVSELQRRNLTMYPIPIRAIGVWDTVGSLGIPRIPWLEMLGLQSKSMRDYRFYDTRLSPCVENAFQALALDERRAPFSPALWEKRDNDRTNLKQVWFPGVHSNVGGGYDDQDLANITLAWMMSRLEPFLDFRSDFLIGCYEDNNAYYKESGQRKRGWAMGEMYNSLMGIYTLAGTKYRTPGDYFRMDPYDGRPTRKHLKNTNEYIHASVRARVGLEGPGLQDRGTYDPHPLREWEFVTEPAKGGGDGAAGNVQGGMVVWQYRGPERASGGQTRIPEAVLLETELALLRQSPRVQEYVKTMTNNPRQGHGDREKRSRSRKRGDESGMNGHAAGPNGYGGDARGEGRSRRSGGRSRRPDSYAGPPSGPLGQSGPYGGMDGAGGGEGRSRAPSMARGSPSQAPSRAPSAPPSRQRRRSRRYDDG